MYKLLIILTLFISATYASNYKIESSHNKSKNILDYYLKKTNLNVTNSKNNSVSTVEFVLNEKENIKDIYPKIYNKLSKLKNDSFLITHIKNKILIIGINKRSTIYGVYHFLEKQLKYKFLSETFDKIPKNSSFNINTVNTISQARFNYREIFIKEFDDNNFALKLGLNGNLGHKAKRKHNLLINTFNTFRPYELIPSKFKNIYPNFFCSGQLDFTIPEVKEYSDINFKKALKRISHKKEDLFLFPHEDRETFCRSSKSQQIINKYSSTTAPFLQYVDYIAKNNPDKNIFFEAYQWSRKAPNNFPLLSKNMNIFFSNIESNFAKPIKSKENNHIYKDLLSWGKYKRDIYIWHYITNFNGYLQPFPNIVATIKDIKTYNKTPYVNGIFLQGAYNAKYSNFSALRAWVFAKLLWNPNLNEKNLIIEFIENYYGEAKDEIIEYFNLNEKTAKSESTKLFVKTSINASYLNKDFIKKSKDILNRALKKVPKNSIYYKHINELYASIDYVQLLKGTISEERKEIFKKFLISNRIKYHAEGRKTDTLSPYFNIKRVKPKAPKNLSNNKKWQDYQEYELKLCCSKTVEDNKASSNSAVRMNGDTSAWGIQLDLNTLPKGNWKVYTSVRVQKSKDLSSINYIKPALYYGIHKKGVKNLSIINTLKDENYHEVYIGKVNIKEKEDGQIWIRPANSKDLKYIFVDRIFIVEDK